MNAASSLAFVLGTFRIVGLQGIRFPSVSESDTDLHQCIGTKMVRKVKHYSNTINGGVQYFVEPGRKRPPQPPAPQSLPPKMPSEPVEHLSRRVSHGATYSRRHFEPMAHNSSMNDV